jgi:hypothetical protein
VVTIRYKSDIICACAPYYRNVIFGDETVPRSTVDRRKLLSALGSTGFCGIATQRVFSGEKPRLDRVLPGESNLSGRNQIDEKT